jgi:hypothetical protein
VGGVKVNTNVGGVTLAAAPFGRVDPRACAVAGDDPEVRGAADQGLDERLVQRDRVLLAFRRISRLADAARRDDRREVERVLDLDPPVARITVKVDRRRHALEPDAEVLHAELEHGGLDPRPRRHLADRELYHPPAVVEHHPFGRAGEERLAPGVEEPVGPNAVRRVHDVAHARLAVQCGGDGDANCGRGEELPTLQILDAGQTFSKRFRARSWRCVHGRSPVDVLMRSIRLLVLVRSCAGMPGTTPEIFVGTGLF